MQKESTIEELKRIPYGVVALSVVRTDSDSLIVPLSAMSPASCPSSNHC